MGLLVGLRRSTVGECIEIVIKKTINKTFLFFIYKNADITIANIVVNKVDKYVVIWRL